ncbi:MAG TPA: phenylalanine--tRNA ligase subunit beta [Rhodospirillaceae bacterium]|nr:MAG: phenylalanine--tRNA ligase subunit beta [Alphaproteobacteria bacterium GWF2_58_20]HAU29737.1 phenylalanine--tRNA ligase subunit beta [Rhodospirillaceae bacterium]
MKFTLSWLKDHIETDAALEDIAHTLTMAGLEVEDIEDKSKALAPFVIAEVLECGRHPNADKLSLCKVSTGVGVFQVVCGAPNVRAGIRVVFAHIGTVIPDSGQPLKTCEIRGVESQGMMCSERELQLSDSHEGIIELPADAPVGVSFAEYAGLSDPVLHVNLTPNRGDCAGVRGIARDLVASGKGHLKPLKDDPVPGTFSSPVSISIAPEAMEGCPCFMGRTIRGVKNGPSPRWLQDRLHAIGLRPISALVDITNYLCFDLARPMHVFDIGKLSGHLEVRLSREGESLLALDEKTYELGAGAVVIADDAGVQSLGGIMGGVPTGCSEATTDVFLECAMFDPIAIAAAGRRLGIESDARYRFERVVDMAFMGRAMEIATRMVLEMCGGAPSDVVMAGEMPDLFRSVSYRPSRVETLGGLAVPLAEQKRILEGLGFGPAENPDGSLQIAVPAWRPDIAGEADIVEEVLRIHGYDKIPSVSLLREESVTRPAASQAQKVVMAAKRLLAARGMMESVTWSFQPHKVAGLFGHTDAGLEILNPISSDLTTMRPSGIGNLLMAAGRNADRGWPDVALFEVGPIFHSAEPEGQETVAAGVRAGLAVSRSWDSRARPVDVFDAKADALAVLEAAGMSEQSVQVTTDAPAWFHPGRSGCLRQGAKVVGWFGELHPGVLETLGIKGRIVAFEVVLSRLPQPRRKGTARPMLHLSSFQPVRRDFAFVMDAGMEAGKLIRAIRGVDKTLVSDVSVFDIYVGPGVGEGRKSLAVSVVLQPLDHTLSDAEIEGFSVKVVAAAQAAGATLRG